MTENVLSPIGIVVATNNMNEMFMDVDISLDLDIEKKEKGRTHRRIDR